MQSIWVLILPVHCNFDPGEAWCLKSPASRLFSGSYQQRKHRSSVSLAVCEGDPLVAGGFPLQRANDMESVPMSWRLHEAHLRNAKTDGTTHIAWGHKSRDKWGLWFTPQIVRKLELIASVIRWGYMVCVCLRQKCFSRKFEIKMDIRCHHVGKSRVWPVQCRQIQFCTKQYR